MSANARPEPWTARRGTPRARTGAPGRDRVPGAPGGTARRRRPSSGQDRGSARAHTILGRFLYEEGELDAAERHFRVAAQGAPNDRELQRFLRLIEGRRKK